MLLLLLGFWVGVSVGVVLGAAWVVRREDRS
jgi:hypothetical protein